MGPRYSVSGAKVLHEYSEKHVDDGVNVVVRGIMEELEVDDRVVDIVKEEWACESVRMIFKVEHEERGAIGTVPLLICTSDSMDLVHSP
jgi:hypothetical protein